MNTLNTEIGKRISQLRNEHHMTQAVLAEKLDISTKHCSEVERGITRLSLEKFVLLCSILHTDMNYLILGKESETEANLNIPSFMIEMYTSSDKRERDLLERYLLMFEEIKNEKDVK